VYAFKRAVTKVQKLPKLIIVDVTHIYTVSQKNKTPLYRVQSFGDFAMFFIDFFAFYMLNVHHISTSGLFDLLT